MPRTVQRYGWRPQLPDHRDFELGVQVWDALPPRVDLADTGHLPPVYDQGQLGSCTGQAIAAAVDFENHKQNGVWLTPSRRWIYYQERVAEGTVDQDSGGQIRDGIKAVHQLGVPPERDCKYIIADFAKHPSTKAAKDAVRDEALVYQAPQQSMLALQACLAAGVPIVFGFTVYSPFESDEVAQTGIVPMPTKADQVVGGHAVMLTGYDNTTQRFRVRNSWGTGWGQGGYFEMPYLYVTSPKLASDFWVIRKTSV